MNHFLKLRSRVLQSLILGFICLTFYTYYRTTGDQEFRPIILGVNISASPLIRIAASPPQNISLEATLTLTSSKNNTTTSEPVSLQLNISQNLINSTLLSSQTLNETTTTTIIKIIDEDSAGAIYEFGHSIKGEKHCPDNGKNIDLIIVVMSAPGNFEARTAIRQTWGHYGQRTDVGVLFIIGTTIDNNLNKKINNEIKLYEDIIRGNFHDSYSNLTLKTISTLEWFDKYCFNAKFLLKTDDDMFINIPRLLLFINKHINDKNIIYGRLAKKWKPIRNKKSKYYVSQGQFKSQYFPDFTTGPAYLLTNDIIGRLFNASLNQTYLKLEDVFTTGIVAQKIGIKRIHANEFLNKRISYSPCNVQHGISIHMVKYGEQFDLWKKLLDGKSKCN